MRQVPLERDINIAVNGPLWMEVANPEHPFTAMLISLSRGTCLIVESQLKVWAAPPPSCSRGGATGACDVVGGCPGG